MNVAWFTPLSTDSAIGEYSIHVTEALAEHCSVDIWVGDDDRHRSTALRTFEFHDEPTMLRRLSRYDVVVYNIGNSDTYHGAIYEAAKHYPGIVVLHDRSYQHLFVDHWLTAGESDEYVERMHLFYGDEGRACATEAISGGHAPWESDMDALRFPLVEEALVGAQGAVVHARDHAEELERRWFGPVTPLFLPSYRGAPTPRPLSLPGRVTLLTLGHVNRNKQIHRVLGILAGRPDLAAHVRYIVVGPGIDEDYGSELVSLCRRQDLQDVSFLGYQPDSTVNQLLVEADVCVNLRLPPLEGSSASLMRQLELGRPVLAFDVGGFAEVPDNAIVKISPDDDDALERALRALVEDASLRDSVGAAAAEYAATLTPQRYAEKFLDFTERVASWAPALRTIDLLGDELTSLGAGRDLPVVNRLGDELNVVVSRMQAVEAAGTPLIRGLGPGDRDSLARFFYRNDVPEITDTFHPFPLTTATAEEIALSPGEDHYYGAFAEGRLIALSMLRGWNEGFEVPSFGIVVDSGWQRRGIGRKLTDFTLDRALWLGSERVRLSVYASNQNAHRMYVARGFQEVEREPVSRNGDSDERIVMLKELRPA